MSPPLAATTRVAIVVALLGVAAAIVLFYRRQNRTPGRMGGAISRAKAVWLGYAVYLWFFLCPLLALDPALALPLRLLLGVFAAFMWLRGVLELVLLFWLKRWTPPMGIGHDLACLALLVCGGGSLAPALAELSRPLDLWTLALLAAVVVSLVCEAVFAYLFWCLVRPATRGHDGIWFASESDPRFRAINRWTAALEAPQVVFLLVYLGACLS